MYYFQILYSVFKVLNRRTWKAWLPSVSGWWEFTFGYCLVNSDQPLPTWGKKKFYSVWNATSRFERKLFQVFLMFCLSVWCGDPTLLRRIRRRWFAKFRRPDYQNLVIDASGATGFQLFAIFFLTFYFKVQAALQQLLNNFREQIYKRKQTIQVPAFPDLMLP